MPPYSERSVLPGESISVEADTSQLTVDTTPGSSSAATPSPTDLEILLDIDTMAPEVQEEIFETELLDPSYYPTPGDLMPFDHAFPDFLRQLTNERNLANVFSLKLRVISRYVSLQRMSLYTINLRELNLEGSILSSLRDIGSNLKFLQILKVGNCQLDSLDGTFGVTSLRQLYAQKNFISDVTPCSNLPYIQHIDLSSNRIRNIAYAGFLTVCRKLKSIVFTGNPATKIPDYRSHVRRILPQIESLDNIIFGSEEIDDANDLNNEFSYKEENIFPKANGISHYNNSFEEASKHSISNESKTFEKVLKANEDSNIAEDISEIQEILKQDNRYFRGRDSHLLSLRREKDENTRFQSSCLDQGKNVDFEETEKISDNCSFFNVNQIEKGKDSLSLPRLRTKENEQKRLIAFEKETHFLKAVDANDIKETKTRTDTTYETSILFSSSTDNKTTSLFNSETEDKQMGAKPRVLSKYDRPHTASKIQISSSNNHNDSFENFIDLQKRPATASLDMLNENENSREAIEKCSKFKSLTTGLPMCGNLAVALRNRKKYQQEQENIELEKYNNEVSTL